MKLTYRILRNISILGVSIFSFCVTSCKKLVEVPGPVTSTNSVNVYKTDATAAAVLTGIYTNISQSYFTLGGVATLSLFPELSADELTLYSGTNGGMLTAYYSNALTNNNTSTSDFWISFYPYIFTTNAAIEGITNSSSLSPAVKQQLLGEAKFIRAFCYFYLVNLYGDVPLALSTDYKTNALLSRTPKIQVYQQIITDLKDAKNLLSSNYLDATLIKTTAERVRPTQWAAAAMLARVYLYYGNLTGDATNYSNAVTEANAVIGNSSLYSLNTLNDVFLANSNEAIWQLQPVHLSENTQDALLFIIPPTGLTSIDNPVYLSDNLLNSFETGDQRKTNWVDTITVDGNLYYFPFKYKINTLGAPVTEYEMVLRLGELYLIRAEANAQLGNSSAAVTDLNVIRNRAGLPNYAGITDKSSLLVSVLHERQVELFTEWGHRWFDLKRAGQIDAVMSVVTPQKGGTWNTNFQWYPIPLSELKLDPNLKQNQGY